MKSLHGSKLLVVGGSSGIGLAVAKRAASEGAMVTIASRSAQKLGKASTVIRGNVETAMIDVTDDGSVKTFFSRSPTYDHVIVTAADVTIKPVSEISILAAQAAMNSKFWGIFRVVKSARIAEGGSLGFVGGFRSTRPAPGLALMSAINSAIEGLTRGLALDLRPIRVNAVSPAAVDTPLWSGMDTDRREALFEHLSKLYPTGAIGQGDDVAAALLMLATNPYATGTVMLLDGGASLV